ncbi:MAG: hypothetical protein LBM02_09715 [Lachnospiraceae bacterium]|jgi:hypothetical protein|nr:hypothetical protein [Lachnospiraceae bacterium]
MKNIKVVTLYENYYTDLDTIRDMILDRRKRVFELEGVKHPKPYQKLPNNLQPAARYSSFAIKTLNRETVINIFNEGGCQKASF